MRFQHIQKADQNVYKKKRLFEVLNEIETTMREDPHRIEKVPKMDNRVQVMGRDGFKWILEADVSQNGSTVLYPVTVKSIYSD